ncbi:MAG: NFACT family protein [Candidatus Latescibacteria bacterium]|jgi:predicted ribosome quality control (RQC) complex YloA/Tae2 family protein|nr:NFACT family protein [Candidatus Latescibacterota bacterium]
MNLSPLTLRKLCDELRPQLDRRLIRDVYLSGQHDLFLDLGDAGHLQLSAHPGRGRVLLTEAPETNDRTRLPWADRYMQNAGIVAVDAVPHERILHLIVRKRDRLGTATDVRIICELIGRYANVILVDTQTDRILGALRQVHAKQNRIREIRPGKMYIPPPERPQAPPETVEIHNLAFLLETPREDRYRALTQQIAGLDPLIAQELLYLAKIAKKERLSEEDLDGLTKTIRNFFANPPFVQGTTLIRDKDKRTTICTLTLQHTQPEEIYPTVSEAIEGIAVAEVQTEAIKGRTKNLVKDLQDRLTTLVRKCDRIVIDLDDATNADQYEKMGNLLMANVAQIPPHSETITLPDLFDPQEAELTIPLNPRRTATENASAFLKRAQKARKGAPILAQRLETTQAQKDIIQDYLDRLNKVKSETELNALREELEKNRLIKPRKNRPATKSKRDEGDIHPRRYRTRDGWLVLVGRNNTENDKLTKTSARDDIFLHAHGCPGSHVILKRDGRADQPPRSTLKEAASLAAYWSKARGSKSVSVNFTEIRYVQKPRGAPAGLVTIRNEKNLMVQPHEIKREDAI